jgi:TolB-like protein/Tfp pilus assembly protein PilF
MISGAVRDALKGRQQLDLQFLGDHELKNIPATVPVYSARKIPMLKMLALRAETRVPRRFHMATVTAALVVLLAGFWFTGDRMGRKSAPLTVSQLSIAVLPFTTSGDMDPDHFVDAIPEQIRTMLSTIPGMRVIGRESSDYFKDHSVSTAEIAQTLKVAWLLRGSLKTVENGIQMTAQLLNAVTDEVVWEDQFQALQQNPATLGPDIGRRIAVSLGVIDSDGVGLPQLLPVTNNAEAHAIYFEALSHIWRGRQRNAIKAVPLLQSAVELDPSFAEAHATLASVYLQTSLLDRQDAYNPELRQELAMQSLQKALSLKPNSPLVLAKAALARLFGDDYTGALALADRALRIDPNNSEALRVRYFVQSEQRNWVGALQTSEQILRLEPLSVNAMSYHVDELQNADRHQEALSIAKMALALYPESEVPQAHAWAAESKLILGDRVGAIESSRKGMPYGSPIDLWTGLEYDWGFFDDIDPVRSAVGLVYVEEYDQVRQLLMDKWGVSDPGSTEVNSLDYLVNRGELEALVGDLNTSVEFFEKARLLAPDEEGGLIKAGVWFRVLDWSRQSHFSLALLFAYRKSGQHEKAQIIAGQFESMVAKSIENLSNVSHLVDYSFLYEEAQYYAIEGRRAEALGKLRTWVDYGKNIFTYIKWDPFLESLHGDPEFEAIVAEVEAELAEVRVLYHARQGELAETGSG